MNANLSEAFLSGDEKSKPATLIRANLTRAILVNAHLSRAVLKEANLYHADLRNADLSHALLGGAHLRRANVEGTDFTGVELAAVVMDFANFSKAKNADIPSYKRNLR
jgi:uncharacterized protein YjbI with pentapeptide repeats